jgi:acyl carrier protein
MDTLKNLSYDAVLLQLESIITDILGEDVVRIVGISSQSAFVADLEMDSIQIAVLADRVNTIYKDQRDFVRWISKRPLPSLLRLTVGDVVDFIVKGA